MMKKVFLATRRKQKQIRVLGYLPVLFLFLLTSACLTSSIPAGEVGQASLPDMMNYSPGTRNGAMTSGDACPTREELITKTKTLQMPFIANNGQVDEQVAFYAKTFGGTVFVTKEGEIVYALPSGRDVPAGASQEAGRGHEAWGQGSKGAAAQGGKVVSGRHGQAPLVRVDAECVAANICSPFLRAGNAHCPPERVLTNALLAVYLPGLQKETTQRVVSTPSTNNPQSKIQNPQSPMRGVALKEHLLGGKVNEIRGGAKSVTTVSYFRGNDPSKWKSNISTCEVVDMGEVYDGIGLRLKAYGNNVEKLFTVMPDANPESIKVGLSGATALRVNEDGQLEAETELGIVKFTKPVAYQEIDGQRVEVDVEYRLSNPNSAIPNPKPTTSASQIPNSKFQNPNSKIQIPKSEYCFAVASYDTTKPLIIDPLLASTFLGGSDWGAIQALALDTSGNVYVAGGTNSTDFPTTRGAYDTSYNDDGYSDFIISKLDSGLTRLLASTYLGGNNSEFTISLALDPSGNVYVAGWTYSGDFPTTSEAYDTFGGGHEGFVSKLDSGLTRLLASTYLGGGGWDVIMDLALDTSGNVYVAGWTNSTNFPTTRGAYDTSTVGYYFDVFVSKLDSELTSLLASTFLGGSNDDYGNSLTLDTSGNVYVTGDTDSTNFPTTSGAYDTSFNGNNIYTNDNVFVSKLDSGLTSLLASTFLGGSECDGEYKGKFKYDYGTALALDTSGNVICDGVD